MSIIVFLPLTTRWSGTGSGPGSQTLLSPKSKVLPATVEIFPSNCQDCQTDWRESSLILITEDKDLG
jgi:hypothetical protein